MTLAAFLDDPGDAAAGIVILIVMVVGSVLIYFIPTFAARGKPQFNSVLAINFFLGWTLVGWVIALAWAVKQDSAPRAIVSHAPLLEPLLCANCGKYSASGSRFCPRCGAAL